MTEYSGRKVTLYLSSAIKKDSQAVTYKLCHLAWPIGCLRSFSGDQLSKLMTSELASYNYLSLVRSNLEYCSQMWAPQAANLILDIERIQRRATKFIPSLPYRSEVSYEQRLLKIGLLLRFGVRIQMFS